ncbi:MAG TPA: MqnA/MqnD/SBP family protein [Rhodothermales bacterium]|nr:MqnA/MqnD/SBP family protein [Rhodothermales bacterium]
MRLAVWPHAPARALGDVLAGVVTEVVEVAPYEAATALLEGRADLALVPTLAVLRDPDAFSVAGGVAFAGERCPTARLVVGSSLDELKTVAFDPRQAQEVLLSSIVLREHFGAQPSVTPVDPALGLADLLGRFNAVLTGDVRDVPEGAVVLDPGQEWLDLTLRPFVWGLLAAPAGRLTPAQVRALAEAARAAEPPPEAFDADGALVYQYTLDGYASDGLEEFARHLFYHGALADVPTVPFVGTGEPAGDATDEENDG